MNQDHLQVIGGYVYIETGAECTIAISEAGKRKPQGLRYLAVLRSRVADLSECIIKLVKKCDDINVFEVAR